MKKEMFDHLLDFLNDHGGIPESVKEGVNPNDTIENQLDDLIGLLCLPENGGIEMVRGILGLEFDPSEFEELIDMNFDRFF